MPRTHKPGIGCVILIAGVQALCSCSYSSNEDHVSELPSVTAPVRASGGQTSEPHPPVSSATTADQSPVVTIDNGAVPSQTPAAISPQSVQNEPAADLKLRVWTDNSGSFKTAAAFESLSNGNVTLKKGDGHTIVVPLSRFSGADQKYVLELSRKEPAASHAEPAERLINPQPIQSVGEIKGKTVSVTDGDTIVVLDRDKTEHKIRLEGIDAPESHQDYGTQSKKALANLVFSHEVLVKWKERDKYNRILGHVYLDGLESRWINKEMVHAGWAWHYREYSSDQSLAQAETLARLAKRGLWQGKDPIAPWDFRHGVQPIENDPKTPKSDVVVYVTNSGSKYHRSGCQYLARSQIPISLSDATRSYSPCSVCGPPTLTSPITASPLPLQQERPNEATVFVTRTGAKYHQAGCQYLSKSKIPISLSDAKARYSPCSVCRPP